MGALAVTTDLIVGFNLGLSFTAALALSGVLALSSLGLVAKVAEGVFRRFGLSSIIAYAATGVLLGPVLGVVEVTNELRVLLGIGIFVFFFLVGHRRNRYFGLRDFHTGALLCSSDNLVDDSAYGGAGGNDGLHRWLQPGFELYGGVGAVGSAGGLGLVAKVARIPAWDWWPR